MKILSKIIYVILTAYLTAVITMKLKASLFTYSNGWDGIAAVLGALMIGLLIGILGGIYSLKWIPDSKLRTSILIVLLLSLAMSFVVYLGAQKRQVKSMRLEKVSVYPKSMGVFKIKFEKDKVVNFLNLRSFDQYGNYSAIDSIKLNENANDIIYAPPWFLPYYAKADYQVLEFEVVSIKKHVVEIITNKQTGQTNFVALESGNYVDWPRHFLSGESLDFIELASVSFHERPIEHASTVEVEQITSAHALSAKGEWLEVLLKNENPNSERIVWCKWFDSEGKVSLRVNYFI